MQARVKTAGSYLQDPPRWRNLIEAEIFCFRERIKREISCDPEVLKLVWSPVCSRKNMALFACFYKKWKNVISLKICGVFQKCNLQMRIGSLWASFQGLTQKSIRHPRFHIRSHSSAAGPRLTTLGAHKERKLSEQSALTECFILYGY